MRKRVGVNKRVFTKRVVPHPSARSPSSPHENHHRRLQQPLHKSCQDVIQFTAAYRAFLRVRRGGWGKGSCCCRVVKIISPAHLALCMQLWQLARTFAFVIVTAREIPLSTTTPLSSLVPLDAKSLNSKEIREEKGKYFISPQFLMNSMIFEETKYLGQCNISLLFASRLKILMSCNSQCIFSWYLIQFLVAVNLFSVKCQFLCLLFLYYLNKIKILIITFH